MQSLPDLPVTDSGIHQNLSIHSPESLTIAITDRCNLNCTHCWVAPDSMMAQRDVPMSQLEQVFEQFAIMGGNHIRLTGGEPLLNPSLFEIIRYAISIKIASITIQTNAVLLDREMILKLRQLDLPGLKLQISLDGANPESHDYVRGQGSYHAVTAALDLLFQEHMSGQVIVHFTEMQHNLSEFPELLELAEKYRLAGVSAGTLITGGRAAGLELCKVPDSYRYLELIENFRRDSSFRRRYVAFGNMDALQWYLGELPVDMHCRLGRDTYLTTDGRLYPCVLCHCDLYAVNSVHEKGFLRAFQEGGELWMPLLESIRKRSVLLEKCLACQVSAGCLGGCAGRALAVYGTIWSTDDRCDYRQHIYRKHLIQKNYLNKTKR